MKLATILLAGAAAVLAPVAARAETACADMAATTLPHAQVTKAAAETADGKTLCRITVTSRPTADSNIGIEVWIPMGSAWNGKFVQVGNGGYAGSIRSAQLRALALQGYAASATDDGHQTQVVTSAAWALGHPEKVVDFAWRAVKETTDISKALIQAQKAQAPARSYFSGCSTGGREALMAAQRRPADFDGIVAGAPAAEMPELWGLAVLSSRAMARPGGHIGPPEQALLQAAVLKQCGGGLYVADPQACRFDPGALRCKAGQTSDCLSAAQVASARAIYDGRRTPGASARAYPGFSPGAEAQPGSWTTWITGPDQARMGDAAGAKFVDNGFKYLTYGDPVYDFTKADGMAAAARAKAHVSPMMDAASPDLRAFKARGGKLIQYHGWNDPAIPALSSIRYHGQVQTLMGDVDGFYRLYMIPGMLHCGGGPGPSGVDWLAKLDDWVERQTPPTAINATTTPVAGGQGQLLCPYPAVAGQAGCAARKPKA